MADSIDTFMRALPALLILASLVLAARRLRARQKLRDEERAEALVTEKQQAAALERIADAVEKHASAP